MVARNRLPPWHEEIRLGNGRDVLIRPIRPEDAPALRAGFELLQPEEIRRRILRDIPAMSVELSRQLAQPDARSEFTLVVSEPLPPGEAMISGVARAAVADGSREAGFTILIGRNVAGMGLGRHLIRRLARWARGKHLDALQGDVSEENEPLLELAGSMGFERVDGAPEGLARVRLPLGGGASGSEAPATS